MDRKDFFFHIWGKLFRPLIIVAIIYYCVKFLYSTILEDGSERFIISLLLVLVILGLLFYLAGLFFNKIKNRIYAKLSPKTKYVLSLVNKICNFIFPFIIGAVIYHFGQQEWLPSTIISIYILYHGIKNILEEEKENLPWKNEKLAITKVAVAQPPKKR